MNKLTLGLMSGVSLVALSFGTVPVAEAANLTIAAPHSAVTVTAASSYDYILVQAGGDVAVNGTGASITNDGTVGLTSGAYGIDVANGGILEGDIVNGGTISAQTHGIYIGASADVKGNVTNTGLISVAQDGIGAGISVIGIYDDGGLVGDIVNSSTGTIDVSGTGADLGYFVGVQQYGDHATFTNGGLVQVSGTGGSANYTGVYQNLDGVSDIDALITNMSTGSIKVDVAATSSEAYIKNGVYQSAKATGGPASVDLENSGLVEVHAYAYASDTTKAVATAYIDYGIEQSAYGVGHGTSETEATATLTNTSTGTIDIKAKATATSAVTAYAYATVEYGIYQYAKVTQDGGTGDQEGDASVSLTNSGVINVIAIASATGASAYAYGKVEYGIYQKALDGDNSSVSLTNSLDGTITIEGQAIAKGGDTVTAYGYVGYGIDQNASAGGDQDSANVSLQNDGTINIHAYATAQDATDAHAYATIYEAIDQVAEESHDSTITLANTGTLDIVAGAKATGDYAYASASVEYGIYQYASAVFANVSSESASLTNSSTGTINIHANAAAYGSTEAKAWATVEYAIYQEAEEYGNTASVSLDNAGKISIVANGFASATNGDASAYASIEEEGIYQYAYADNKELSSSATLTNEAGATLDIKALATATAKDNAYAYATINTGIYQEAYYGDASVSLTNAGTLDIVAEAKAFGNYAHAAATISSTGIYQYAYATGNPTVSASLTNASTGVLKVVAEATASGVTDAYAYATIDGHGIYQEAEGGLASSVTLDNAGTLDIEALAKATGGGAKEYAYADITDYVIYQYAYGSDTIGSTATDTLTNESTGTLNIIAQATAVGNSGAADGSAYAYIDEVAIYQNPYHASTASATLTNAGTLNIEALAKVDPVDYAYAEAYIDVGIEQYVLASEGDKLSSTASLTNTSTGVLNVIAQATATATTDEAYAYAYNNYPIYQDAYYGKTASVTLDNAGTMSLEALAKASATSGEAYAYAEIIYGIYQSAYGTGTVNSVAAASLTNDSTGVLTIEASANAKGATSASAYAYLEYYGIYQEAHEAADASVTLANSGTINLWSNAKAVSASESAYAYANIDYGIYQYAYATDTTGSSATATLTNASTGTINIAANATATGSTDGYAEAYMNYGVYQYAYNGFTSTATIDNAGALNISVTAKAVTAFSSAYAYAYMDYGIHQEATASVTTGSEASVTLTNESTGTISIKANAWASGANSAYAYGELEYPIVQEAYYGDNSTVTLDNSGKIDIAANAYAKATGYAYADAYIDTGIYQDAYGPASASVAFTNESSGTVDIAVQATAVGNTAVAYADINPGVYQAVSAATDLSVSFTNSGTFTVSAKALATGANSAYASAYAGGVEQDLGQGGDESFTNSGTFKVTADAAANGAGTDSAYAFAYGLYALVENGGTLNVLNASAGVLDVTAEAHGTTGYATAVGFIADDKVAGDTLTGTIENDGHLNVMASAPDVARAAGIGVRADEFTGTITNKGTIHVAAIGATPTAIGIGFTTYSAPTGLGTGTVVNDGGTIWAGVSTDGFVFTRGDAIDVLDAPNQVNIDLKGNGDIYGDINIVAGDTITVSGGKTKFDGIINDPTLVGTLAISTGGTLELANGLGLHNQAELPAQAYVNTYTQAGTLELELTPTPVAAGPALHTAGLISANNVTLTGGTLLVAPDPGLYGPSTKYQVVFSANPITNPWTNGSVVPTTTNSILLQPTVQGVACAGGTCEEDIVLTRLPFDAPFGGGLTPNEKSTGGGLEGGYSTSLVGAYAGLYEALFGLDAAEYPAALDMLSGEEAGELVLSNLGTADQLTNAITDHLSLSAAGGNTQSSALPQTVKPAQSDGIDPTVWGGFYGNWGSGDNTISGPGYTSSEGGLVAGIDAPVAPNIVAGGAFSYTFDGTVSFDKFGKPVGNHATYDGFQIAGYGRYDSPEDNFYLQGAVSYGSYNDKTKRYVSLPAPFGAGSVMGSFSTDVWTFYGEGGVKLVTEADAGVNVTPYLAFSYENGTSGAYVEHGLTGANLAVSDASATSEATYLGVKLDRSWDITDIGALVTTFKTAWRHEFDDDMWTVNAAFNGIAGSGYSINGSALGKDSAAVGVSLGYAVNGNVTTSLDYEGDYSSDRSSSSVMGRVKVQF